MAAEDDEIDILGDFTFDSCLSKNERTISSYSDLLQCDYTVHPQWLLDTATTACWYDNPQHDEGTIKSEVSASNSNNFSDDDTQPSTSRHTTLQWTSSERELLQKGMEVYGSDPSRLSVFLGSKSPSEVQLFIETEYGIHLETDTPGLSDQNEDDDLKARSSGLDYGDILTDNEIPASIEEVICMVSTAEPTVPGVKNQINIKNIIQKNPRSILKKNFSPNKRNANRSLLKNSHNEIRTELFTNPSISSKDNGFHKDPQQCNDIERYKAKDCSDLSNKGSIKNVVKTHTSFPNNEIITIYQERTENPKSKKYPISPGAEKNKRRQKSDFGGYEKSEKYDKKSKFNISLTLNKVDSLSRLVNKRRRKSINSIKRKGSKQKFIIDKLQPSPEQTSMMQIVTGSGQALPLSAGEQVIKIEKSIDSGAESDIEIDVDSDCDVKPETPVKKAEPIEHSKKLLKDFKKESFSSADDENDAHPEKINDVDIKSVPDVIKHEDKETKPLVIPEGIRDLMMSMDVPLKELFIDPTKISDMEKFLYPDFFEGRPAKTPERYKLIRTHLINSWKNCRPFYLTKTGARHGLRNCGDVNCIGRIHTLMEQIGAINFNCEQTSYIRPLSLLLTRTAPNAPSVLPTQPSHAKVKQFDDTFKPDISRQRKKKLVVDGDGGYTITHSEFGEFYEAISEPRQQRAVKKKPISLMYCKSFTEDYPAPYNVKIALSALILMDFHSHTSRAEVMGLLGGHYYPDKKLMSIELYVPCDSLENSGTHCDMCPVSQSAASEVLAQQGMEPLGWHHSHPLFPPQPSAQDLRSQADLQAAFCPRPFLALILSPHWPPGRSASQYKCLLVKKDAASEQEMAFRFKTHLHCDITTDEDIKVLLGYVEKIWTKNQLLTGNFVVDMKNDICSNARITYLDKCVSSIRHHLISCENKISQSHCEAIVDGVRGIVR